MQCTAIVVQPLKPTSMLIDLNWTRKWLRLAVPSTFDDLAGMMHGRPPKIDTYEREVPMNYQLPEWGCRWNVNVGNIFYKHTDTEW